MEESSFIIYKIKYFWFHKNWDEVWEELWTNFFNLFCSAKWAVLGEKLKLFQCWLCMRLKESSSVLSVNSDPKKMTRDPKVLFWDGTELLHAYPFLHRFVPFNFPISPLTFYSLIDVLYHILLYFVFDTSLSLIAHKSLLVDPFCGRLISWSQKRRPTLVIADDG